MTPVEKKEFLRMLNGMKKQLDAMIFMVEKGKVIETDSHEDLHIKAKNMVNRIGIKPHLLGYKYLIKAFELIHEDEGILHAVTISLYPQIAAEYGETASRVERAIRHAKESAFATGNVELLHELFYKEKRVRGIPTNTEFMATIMEMISE